MMTYSKTDEIATPVAETNVDLKTNLSYKVGIICSLSGRYKGTGIGYLESIRFAISELKEIKGKSSVKIDYELIIKDDKSVFENAFNLYQECVQDGCICVFGPVDSGISYEILSKASNSIVPLFLPLSSATFLSSVNSNIFYRSTTSDYTRSKALIDIITRENEGKKVYVYSYSGEQNSYSQGIKKDVTDNLSKMNIDFFVEDFDETDFPSNYPLKGSPIIICAISKHTVLLAKHLRKKRFCNQIFTFGSNTNLLHKSLINSIVICDLDRNDTNYSVRRLLSDFQNRHNDKNPSLSTINTLFLVNDYLSSEKEPKTKTPRDLSEKLKSEYFEGLMGECSFTEKGEYIGREQLSTLMVSRKRRGMNFKVLNHNTTVLNTISRNKYYWKIVLAIIGFLSLSATIYEVVMRIIK